MSETEKHRVVVMALSLMILVTMVLAVGVCIFLSEPVDDGHHEHKQSPATVRAVKAMCGTTDDDDKTCVKYVLPAAGDNTDIKELIKVAFEVTMTNITEAGKKSEILEGVQEDPRTKQALADCKELMDSALLEIQKSFDHVEDLDITKPDEVSVDLRMWLSAASTYQETCLDGLKNTSGDADDKMKSAIVPGRLMTSHSLTIVDELPNILKLLKQQEADGGHDGDDASEGHEEEGHGKGGHDGEDGGGHEEEGHGDDASGGHEEEGHGEDASGAHDEGHGDETGEDYEGDEGHGKEAGGSHDEEGHGHRRLMSKMWDDEAGMRRLLEEDSPLELKPLFVVAKDGSGDYGNVAEALENIQSDNDKPVVIRIKAGIYKESVEIGSSMTNVVLVGEGAKKTRFTGDKNFIDATPTYRTATFAVKGDFFIAKNIGFENTAGPEKHQAVALRVQSDKSIFYNCSIEGFEHTLYTHTNRQFYRDCTISGTVDFVFGNAAAVFQNCVFRVRKPMDNQKCIVTAHGRRKIRQPTGLIIQNSTFVADDEYYPVRKEFKSYLGRPRKIYSRTIVMKSYMDDLIDPEGWLAWHGDHGLSTCFYAELENKGPGADTGRRVTWKAIRKISKKEVEESYVASKFVQGDSWVKGSGVPYVSGYGGPKDSKTSNSTS